MYFHAGQDFVLNTRDVIGVFDLDTAGASCRTEEYFRSAEDNGAVVDLCAPGSQLVQGQALAVVLIYIM